MASAPCPDCGVLVELAAVGPRSKRCDACKVAKSREKARLWRERNPERAAERVRAWKAAHREEIRVAARKDLSQPLRCAECGDEFKRAGGRGPIPRLCPECHRLMLNARDRAYRAADPEKHRDQARRANARRRAAHRAEDELVIRRRVFDRDGWVCQLCDGVVDPTAKHPDPWSASLDHVLPLSLGGRHTYANTQLAHLRCNLVKNNRVSAEAS